MSVLYLKYNLIIHSVVTACVKQRKAVHPLSLEYFQFVFTAFLRIDLSVPQMILA